MREETLERILAIEKEKEAQIIEEILKDLSSKEKKDLLLFIKGMKFAEIMSMK